MTDQEQIDALKAQVNCLREALDKAKDKLSNENIYDNNIRFALQATPEQCLAEVKAKAIEEYKLQQAELKQLDMVTKIMTISV